MKEQKLVLSCGWYVPDGWYGQRYRAILQPSKDDFFITKTEANKYKSLLRKYAVKKFHSVNSKTKLNLVAAALDTLKTFIYCGAGPSYSCTHILLTVDELNEFAKGLK